MLHSIASTSCKIFIKVRIALTFIGRMMDKPSVSHRSDRYLASLNLGCFIFYFKALFQNKSLEKILKYVNAVFL